MQLCFRGADGHAGQLRNLGVPVALDVVQHQHRAGPLREPRDGPLEVGLQRTRDVAGTDRRALHVLVHGRLVAHAPYPDAAVAERDIHRQAVQPGSEAAVAAELRQLAPGPDEGLLQEVLGQRRITAAQSPAERVDAVAMRAIQPLEGRRITLAGPLDPNGLVVLCARPFGLPR